MQVHANHSRSWRVTRRSPTPILTATPSRAAERHTHRSWASHRACQPYCPSLAEHTDFGTGVRYGKDSSPPAVDVGSLKPAQDNVPGFCQCRSESVPSSRRDHLISSATVAAGWGARRRGHRLDTHRNSPAHRPQRLIHYLGHPLIQVTSYLGPGGSGSRSWWVTDARRRPARIFRLTAHSSFSGSSAGAGLTCPSDRSSRWSARLSSRAT